MTDYSALTKALLLERIGALSERLKQYEELAVNVSQPEQPEPVPEADALAACVRAFEALPKERDRSNLLGYNIDHRVPPAATMERILRSLASRYGVRLIEVERQPCTRQHLDELSARQLVEAGLSQLDGPSYLDVTGSFPPSGGRR